MNKFGTYKYVWLGIQSPAGHGIICREHCRTTKHTLHVWSSQNHNVEFEVPQVSVQLLKNHQIRGYYIKAMDQKCINEKVPPVQSETKHCPREPPVRFWRQKEKVPRVEGVIKDMTPAPRKWWVRALYFPPTPMSGQTHWHGPLGRGQIRQPTHLGGSQSPAWGNMGDTLATVFPLWHLELTLGTCFCWTLKRNKFSASGEGFWGTGDTSRLVFKAAPHTPPPSSVFLEKQRTVTTWFENCGIRDQVPRGKQSRLRASLCVWM